MALTLATPLWNVILEAVKTRLDAGSGPALLKFYDGTRPATGGTATTLQATLVLADPVGSVTGAVLTFTAGGECQRVAGDPITWCRFFDSDNVILIDANVGVSGSGADVEVSSVTGGIGGFLRLTSGTFGE